MADAQTGIEFQHIEEHTGYQVKRYKIVLSGGATTFTLDDESWMDIVEMRWFDDTGDTSCAVYWDGSDVKGTGFTANGTIKLTVIGRVS
ncbi:MAG: hypothetical protein JRL30_27610 [Deltaproteobacteria bacterium]|nr:hypothetical protein [Deltaproteobacteria bacterium]